MSPEFFFFLKDFPKMLFQNMVIRKTSLIAKCNEKENGVLMRKIFIQSGWR